MKCFTLRRLSETPLSTLGELIAADGVTSLCSTLERGPQNVTHPRIRAGTYDIAVRRKPFVSKFDRTLSGILGATYQGILWLPHVTGRSNIEIHPANTFDELLGCIAPGQTSGVDALGEYCVFNSRDAYQIVYPIIAQAINDDGAQLNITDI